VQSKAGSNRHIRPDFPSDPAAAAPASTPPAPGLRRCGRTLFAAVPTVP